MCMCMCLYLHASEMDKRAYGSILKVHMYSSTHCTKFLLCHSILSYVYTAGCKVNFCVFFSFFFLFCINSFCIQIYFFDAFYLLSFKWPHFIEHFLRLLLSSFVHTIIFLGFLSNFSFFSQNTIQRKPQELFCIFVLVRIINMYR